MLQGVKRLCFEMTIKRNSATRVDRFDLTLPPDSLRTPAPVEPCDIPDVGVGARLADQGITGIRISRWVALGDIALDLDLWVFDRHLVLGQAYVSMHLRRSGDSWIVDSFFWGVM